MKVCSKCKIEKPFDEFYKNKSRKDGLNSECKSCKAEMSKDRNKKLKKRINIEVPSKKTCTKCNIEKSSNEFYKSKSHIDGLRSRCKSCVKEYEEKLSSKISNIKAPKTKKCNKCGVKKSSSEFIKNKRRKYGLSSRCKDCLSNDYKNRSASIHIKIPKTKKCSKCKIEKPSSEFSKHKANKNGLQTWCKSCVKEYHEKLAARKYIETPKTKKCSKCGIEKLSKEFYKARRKASGLNSICKKCKSKYTTSNKNREARNKRHKDRYKNDEIYRLNLILRGFLKRSIKLAKKSSNEEIKKSKKSVEYIGCTIEELKNHLEKQFYPHPETGEEMTWENHAFKGWHVDHIKPLSSFDLTSEKEIMKANHYTNLQPLWSEENLSKNNRYEE